MNLISLLRSLTIVVFLCVNSFYSYANDLTQKQTLISVDGSHTITIVSDQATIRASVITQNTAAKQAVQDNANIMKKIRDILKKEGFDAKKLVSGNYQLISNYDYDNGKQIFRNYQVNHDISFTVDNIDKIGIVADLLTSSGVNQISQIEFTSSKYNDAYNNALKSAVIDAKKKAELAISGINGLSVGKALAININPSHMSNPPVMYEMARVQAMVEKNSPTEIQPQGQNITVNVHTTWEIVNH